MRIITDLCAVEAVEITERAIRVGKQWKQLSNLYKLNLNPKTLVAPRHPPSSKVTPKVVTEEASPTSATVVRFPRTAKAEAQ